MVATISNGHWNDQQLSCFVLFNDELSKHDALIIQGHHLVISSILPNRTVDIAYHSHQGIVKTKQLIRGKVWFPGTDKLVEETMRSCFPCQASNPTHSHREPIHTTPLPTTPWTEISRKFAGPFPFGDYLPVAIDDHCRFLEVEVFPLLSPGYDFCPTRLPCYCQV